MLSHEESLIDCLLLPAMCSVQWSNVLPVKAGFITSSSARLNRINDSDTTLYLIDADCTLLLLGVIELFVSTPANAQARYTPTIHEQ
jgi:hypothetical protein